LIVHALLTLNAEMVLECINRCDVDVRKDLYQVRPSCDPWDLPLYRFLLLHLHQRLASVVWAVPAYLMLAYKAAGMMH
jgi:hypothetical protein